MKLDQTHIQYHPEYATVFITFLPDKIGAKFMNNGRAVDREWEFFFAVSQWAKKAAFVPPAFRWLRKILKIRPKFQIATRTWKHPDGDLEVTVTVRDRFA